MRLNFDKSPIFEKKKEDCSNLCGKVIDKTVNVNNVDKHLRLMKSNSQAFRSFPNFPGS